LGRGHPFVGVAVAVVVRTVADLDGATSILVELAVAVVVEVVAPVRQPVEPLVRRAVAVVVGVVADLLGSGADAAAERRIPALEGALRRIGPPPTPGDRGALPVDVCTHSLGGEHAGRVGGAAGRHGERRRGAHRNLGARGEVEHPERGLLRRAGQLQLRSAWRRPQRAVASGRERRQGLVSRPRADRDAQGDVVGVSGHQRLPARAGLIDPHARRQVELQ
jgi:hypothetical protein